MTNVAQEFDTGDEGEANASPDALAQLRKSISDLISLNECIATMEDDLKAAKAAFHALRTSRLPDIMAQIQSDHFTYEGYKIDLTDFVSGSLPKDPAKRQKALEWLEKNEGGSLIRTDLAVTFGKSQHNNAIDLAEQLKEKGYSINVNMGVHAQSLQAFARECIRSGRPIEAETLGLFIGKVVKIKKLEK
jgi:hypothetical protein